MDKLLILNALKTIEKYLPQPSPIPPNPIKKSLHKSQFLFLYLAEIGQLSFLASLKRNRANYKSLKNNPLKRKNNETYIFIPIK